MGAHDQQRSAQEHCKTMIKEQSVSTRLPRGTRPVTQAFFSALDAVPEASRGIVAKAAQTLIRDELKVRREKNKAVTAKTKPVVAAKMPKVVEAPVASEPRKPRGRKRAEIRTAA
jgi:hypothetical protein